MINLYRFFIIILLTSLISCGGGSTDEVIPGNSNGDDLAELGLPQMDDYEFIADSFAKIDSAEAAGDLTAKDAMALRLVAGYEPELLATEYSSEVSYGRSSLQQAEMWLQENYDSLDVATQTLLRPYYVMPNDPESYLNKQQLQETLAATVTPGTSLRTDLTWNLLTASILGTNADIFYLENSQQADWIKQALLTAYPKYNGLLSTHTYPQIYIFIQPMSDYGSAASIVYEGAQACRIKIRTGLDDELTKAALAHELFHCFQFAIGIDNSIPVARDWAMEATAVWSENYVYPDFNTEHEYLKTFFKDLDTSLIANHGVHEYGSYMWFLFLQQYFDDAKHISDFLYASHNDNAIKVITEMDSFDYLFSEFNLWNWNKQDLKKYEDFLDIPGNAYFLTHKIETQDTHSYDVTVKDLSAEYRVYSFKEGISKVKVVADALDEGNFRHVLIRQGDEWHVEDWTLLEDRTFCRHGDETLLFVMINSNSRANEFTDSLVFDTTEECESSWSGTTIITWDHETASNGVTLLGTGVSYLDSTSGTYYVDDEIFIDEYGDANLVMSTVRYDKEDIHRIDYDRSCGLIWEEEKRVTKGVKTFEYIGERYPPTRWQFDDYPEDATVIEFDPSTPGGDSENWYVTTTTSSTLYDDCNSTTASPVVNESIWSGKIVSFDIIPLAIPEDSFAGTVENEITNDYGTYLQTITYDYKKIQ